MGAGADPLLQRLIDFRSAVHNLDDLCPSVHLESRGLMSAPYLQCEQFSLITGTVLTCAAQKIAHIIRYYMYYR